MAAYFNVTARLSTTSTLVLWKQITAFFENREDGKEIILSYIEICAIQGDVKEYKMQF